VNESNLIDPFDNLCSYDPRSRDYTPPDEDDEPRKPRNNCYCDDCFYRRDPLSLEILRLRGLLDRHRIDWKPL
jgi:hypothetical protein